MELNDKVIAITGGARGLGLAMARYLGNKGALLALLDIEQGALDDAVASLEAAGVKAQGFVANVADEASVTAALFGHQRVFGAGERASQ